MKEHKATCYAIVAGKRYFQTDQTEKYPRILILSSTQSRFAKVGDTCILKYVSNASRGEWLVKEFI